MRNCIVEKGYVRLTERERENITLVVSGLSNKHIARQLDISVRTVEGHRFRLMEKMQVASLRELVEMAKAMEKTRSGRTDTDPKPRILAP